MNKDEFLEKINKTRELNIDDRFSTLVNMHREIFGRYTAALETISDDQSSKITKDGRTVTQVIGHIAEWERFIFQSLGEIISGVKKPRFYSFKGYVDVDGSAYDFATIDEFNAYQTKKYRNIPWTEAREFAIYISRNLLHLFSKSSCITPELLENTTPLKNKAGVPVTTMGWQLWVIVLEHGLFEHASALGL